MIPSIPGYKLLDSGEGRKLEQYGDLIVDRPSSLCAWSKRSSTATWQAAAAFYTSQRDWVMHSRFASPWTATIAGVTIELECMSNGQLGIFPEHALYLDDIRITVELLSVQLKRPVKVLNLFAYTGLATCFCALLPQAHVTHVDLAKRAIESAKRNAANNSIASDRIRWIVDDALTFMAREQRKDSRYDVVIIDPPSFSRVSKSNTWTLDEKAPDIVKLVLGVLTPEAGVVFFTNHSSASTSDVARNIALDTFADRDVSISIHQLALQEEFSPRRLPAGSLIVLSHGVHR
jgi:23S rRNA (cytosine1962-C5)-methyltransferase